jgi:hypothetical protein
VVVLHKSEDLFLFFEFGQGLEAAQRLIGGKMIDGLG